LNVSQAEIAKGTGVSRESITSYEVGRVAVPCQFALSFCWGLTVSERWLAEGPVMNEKDFRQTGRSCQGLIAEAALRRIPSRTLFSVAWKETLKQIFERLEKEGGGAARFVFARGDDPRVAERFIEANLDALLASLTALDLTGPRDELPPTFRFVRSLTWEALKIRNTLTRPDRLTEYERWHLLDEAIKSGAFPKSDLGNSEKENAYVAQHLKQYLLL
jgi:hypothetical protein